MSTGWILPNAMSTVFCFPIYSYPILLTVSIVIETTFQKLHERFQYKIAKNESSSKLTDIDESIYDIEATTPTSYDSEIVQTTVQQNKQLIKGYFNQFTPLQPQIIDLVIEYFYDFDTKKLWMTKLDSKDRLLGKLYNGHILMMSITNFVCLVLIIWINWTWIIKNDARNSWTGFQSLAISMMFYHPTSKMISLVSILANEGLHKSKRILVPWIITVVLTIAIDICGCLIYGVASLFYYIPVWIVFVLVLLLFQWIWDKLNYECVETFWPFVIMFVLYLWLTYAMLVYTTSSMACIYSKDFEGKGQWYLCLYHTHCPNSDFIFVNWKDWRAIFLLMSWILF